MAIPARRVAPTGSRGHTYSTARLRLVVTLLTILTLPVVVGSAVLIYYYLRYNVMVDRRLQGERFGVPARLYARPLLLRNGLPLPAAGLVKVLNGLKYEQKSDIPAAEGEFAVGSQVVSLSPRAMPGAPTEPVAVVFEKDRIKEMRGLQSKNAYPTITLEPELITYLFDDTREKRRIVKYKELPDHLVKAVLAIEDRRFFSHPGLDPFRIIAAAIKNIQAESYIQGGSTITQQLVKNFFLTPERTMKRKLQEALLAFVLERRAEKTDILELYLNEVYLGQVGSFSIHGVGEAARMYFHKDVGNLTLGEAALVAGMIQSPNPYNPYRHRDRARDRRNQVLKAMNEAGFLEEATAEAAMAQPVNVLVPSVESVEAPYFVDLVKMQMAARKLPIQNVAVQTSLDLSLQAFGQRALSEGLAKVDKMIRRKKSRDPVQGALIALEPRTGAIVALVGGRAYGSSQYNRAIAARRQPGSTFKPFVYLAAFEATFESPNLPPITPATMVEDAPTVFIYDSGRQEYMPANYEDKYLGYVTLRRALAHSLNNATVKVAEMVGYERVTRLWNKKMGMAAGGNPGIRPFPAAALGAFEATPLELAAAYNVLANGGLKIEPVTVLGIADEKGQPVPLPTTPPPRVVRPESAYLTVSMMRSVLNNGTAAGARSMGFTADAAGKTGTTNDMRDAWFIGFTPELLCVVWVGFDDNSPLNLSGARAALPIWVEFMKGALAGIRTTSFRPSGNVVFVEVDPQTGMLATPGCPSRLSETFIAGTEPQEYCSWHTGGYIEPPLDSPLPPG